MNGRVLFVLEMKWEVFRCYSNVIHGDADSWYLLNKLYTRNIADSIYDPITYMALCTNSKFNQDGYSPTNHR